MKSFSDLFLITVGVKYRDYLRAIYTRSELPDIKWPPSPGKKFINLAVITKERMTHEKTDEYTKATLRGDIDQILKYKVPVKLENILKAEADEQLKCVLVEGAPGVGKSTLAWHVCQQWGKGEQFQEFTTVQLLQLRDARVQAATCVEDLFPHYDKKLQNETVQEISNSHGEDTLIILDGLDELPNNFLSQHSIFTGLLSGEVLPRATIMVTSRPSATYKLWTNWKQQISRHIEIIGFTQDNITEYVKSVLLHQDLPQFESYLSMHPHIKFMMYVPLHTVIVTIVYSDCQTSYRPPPETITGLYTCLTQTILIRYLNDHPVYRGQWYCLDCFRNLPQPVYDDFIKLCKIAFDGVNDQKQIFYDLTESFDHLGFMAAVPELTLYRQPPRYSHNFLHFSVQEFLAAYYFSCMSPQEQEPLLKSIVRHSINTIRFLAGITQFNDLNKAMVREVLDLNHYDAEADIMLEEHQFYRDKSFMNWWDCKDLGQFEVTVLLIQPILEILFESQNVGSILDTECHYKIYFDLTSPRHHHHVIGYCIATSQSKWTLRCHGKSDMVDRSGDKSITQNLKDGKAYTIEKLCLTNCPSEFSKCLLMAVESLKIIHLSGPGYTLQSFQAFASMFQQKSLTEVNITKCNIDNNYACCLSRVLHSNTRLRVLNVSHNSVGSVGAEAMAEMLRHNTTLEVLDVRHNSVGDEGVLVMAKVLKHNTTLTKLNISHNSIGLKGAREIALMLKYNTPLTVLDMSSNKVGEEGAIEIAEAMEVNNTLGELNMSFNSLREKGALAMIKILKHNTALTVLDIGDWICCRTVQYINRYCMCDNGNTLGDEGTPEAEIFEGVGSILNIGENSICDETAAALIEVSRLNNTLEVLNLSGNSVSDEGALAMVQMVKHNCSLRVLNLSGNSMGDEGVLAMAEMLKHNDTLEVLNLSGIPMGDKGALAMAKMHEYTLLEVLNLSGNSVGDEGALAMALMLNDNCSLRVLNLSGNSMGDEGVLAMAEMLKHNDTLEVLNLSRIPMGDKGALAMAKMHEYTLLEVLNLSGNSVGDEGALAMALMLNDNCSLRVLNLSGNSMGDEGVLAMAEMLKHNDTLEVLNLSGIPMGDKGALAMAKNHECTLLEVLNLSGNSVGDEGALAMAQMVNDNCSLRVLNLSGNSVGDKGALAMAEMLKHNIVLQVLNLSGIPMGDKGALAITKMCQLSDSTLEVLNLSGNTVSDEGALAVVQMLEDKYSLRVLNLSGNSVGDEVVLSMVEMLKNNDTLEVLNFSGIPMGDKGALALFEVSIGNDSLEVLNIGGIPMGLKGVLAIAEILRYSYTLEVLNLSEISMGDDGVLAMAKMLKHNDTLEVLNLSGISTGNKGAIEIAKALEDNSTIQVLNLGDTSMSDKGVIGLINCNTTLKVLDLSRNSMYMNDEEALAMAEMLKHNTTLEVLGMGGSLMGTVRAVAEILKYNKTLRVLNDVKCN